MKKDQIRLGIESESLRLDTEGALSMSPHPFPLHDRYFSRDFSESQLEMVTDPHPTVSRVLKQVEALHAQALHRLKGEQLWPFSMPPALPSEEEIPIARYPWNSPEGRKAEQYRHGLSLRYGKTRQMICGIHVNISIEDGQQRMLNAARFFYQHLDTMILLTGATPVSLTNNPRTDKPSVSLRNSPGGYGGTRYREYLNLQSIRDYVEALEEGLNRVDPDYHSLGLVQNGKILQISDRFLQSEKEFYAPIRLRRIPKKGETQLQALQNRGIEYLELRFIDKDPYFTGGINPFVLGLIELVFLKGLKNRSPLDEQEALGRADKAAAMPLHIWKTGDSPEARELQKRARNLIRSLESLAESRDREDRKGFYRETVDHFKEVLSGNRPLTSARIYQDFKESGKDWTRFGQGLRKENNYERAINLIAAGI